MGTDVHMVYQAKNPASGKFEDIGISGNEDEFEIQRDYALFAALAGVRNSFDITPISEPRGLPEDYEPNQMDYHYYGFWIGDWALSWLGAEEIIQWFSAPENQEYVDKRDEMRRFSSLISNLRDQHGEVRIVFGFDS